MVNFLINVLYGLGVAGAVDNLFGSRVWNKITTGKFESNYDRELRQYNEENVKNKNQSNTSTNTKTSSRGGFFGIGGDKKTTGEERRLGILSFLGDRSRKLDDAPDIVERNEQVLGGVNSYGGLLPPMTIVPNINNERILDLGFEGVRKEIEKINGNIDAIRSAMVQSALLESSYRDSMISSMRRDLVEKGKDRSDTRTEKSIFNLLTRSEPQKSVSQNTKSLSDRLGGSLGMALGLNLANFGLNLFDDDTETTNEESGEGNILIDDKETKEKMSTYGFDDKNFELIEGEDGNYKIVPKNNNETSEGNILIDDKETKEKMSTYGFDDKNFDLIMGADGNYKIVPKNNNETSSFEPGFFSEVDNKTAKRIIELEDQGIYGDDAMRIIELEKKENAKKIINEVLPFNETFGDNFLDTIIPISTNFTPVQPGSGSFEIIDLRTIKKEGKKAPNTGGATTQLNNTIPKLNPSKSYSIFESFLKEHP